jgi:hypothetical protein
MTAGEEPRREKTRREETRREEACAVREVATWAPDAFERDFDE